MFTIITPTYKRSELLKRAIASVQQQTHSHYKHIIICDSPQDASYNEIAKMCAFDPRITYITNKENKGVNFTRNHALSLADKNSWVIFLDDDDYLAPDALSVFLALIEERKENHWFMTNRAYANGVPITYAPGKDTTYSYAIDYLLTKRIKRDATHCISMNIINKNRFAHSIKQGEEWFFFYQVGLTEKIFYTDHNSTLSDGYDQEHGLNFRTRTRKERLITLVHLFHEGIERALIVHPTFLLYLMIRTILLLKP